MYIEKIKMCATAVAKALKPKIIQSIQSVMFSVFDSLRKKTLQ